MTGGPGETDSTADPASSASVCLLCPSLFLFVCVYLCVCVFIILQT